MAAPLVLPDKATFSLPVTIVAQGSVEGLPPLEESPTVVGLHVHVAALEERATKGWALTAEQLGGGWRSMEGSFVNMGHDPKQMYGAIRAAAQENGSLFAALALSRAKLKAENTDVARLKSDFSVSGEWTYTVPETYLMHNDERIDMEEAANRNLLALNSTPGGGQEIVVTDPSATMYPGGINFGDIALVPLNKAKPAFPSATILAATAADGKLMLSDSMESFIAKVVLAVRGKFSWMAPDGVWERPWVIATFQNSVVFENTERNEQGDYVMKTYRCDFEITDDGVTLGDATEVDVDQQYVAKNEAARAAMFGSDEDGIIFLESVASDMQFAELLFGNGTAPIAKSGGHKSPPSGLPSEPSSYVDGQNYMFPVDTRDRVMSSIASFRIAVLHRAEPYYSRPELIYLAKQLVGKAKAFGIHVDPRSLVGRYAGMEVREEAVVERPPDPILLYETVTGRNAAKFDFIDTLYGDGAEPKKKKRGHKKPPPGLPKKAECYADGVNFKFAVDTTDNIGWAITSFEAEVINRTVGYDNQELVWIAKKIAAAASAADVEVQPTTFVGRFAGLKA